MHRSASAIEQAFYPFASGRKMTLCARVVSSFRDLCYSEREGWGRGGSDRAWRTDRLVSALCGGNGCPEPLPSGALGIDQRSDVRKGHLVDLGAFALALSRASLAPGS